MAKPENKIEEAEETEAKSADETEEDGEEGGGQEGEGQEESKKKLSGKKLILFYILPATLAILIGVTLAIVLFNVGSSDDGVVAEEEAVAEDVVKQVVFYELPEMLVNLNTKGRKASYLKISVSLELEDPNNIPRI